MRGTPLTSSGAIWVPSSERHGKPMVTMQEEALFVRHALNELFGMTQRNGFVKRSSRRFHLTPLRGRPHGWSPVMMAIRYR